MFPLSAHFVQEESSSHLSLSVFFHLSFTVMMDLRAVLTISLLLMSTDAATQTPTEPSSTTTSPPTDSTISKNNTVPTSPSITPKSSSAPSAPSLGLLSVNWTSDCGGEVVLLLLPPSSSSHLCHSSLARVETLLSSPCERRSGCEGPPRWKRSNTKIPNGYDITEHDTRTSCESLMLQCTPQTDVQGQLKAYKVVTALFCCLLLVLILIRFTKPTVKALQSRLSDRRQNRWIGPTQSHSVSYHRGKGVAQSTDREMRMSYPALERLTVNDSREPSSNRNSGYTF